MNETAKLTELHAAIGSLVERHFTSALQDQARQTRGEVVNWLNQAARRMRASSSTEECFRTLAEVSGVYCSRAEVFTVTPKGLALGSGDPVPLASAPAFASVVESKDTAVAVGTPRELSPLVFEWLGNVPARKVYLFPVVACQTSRHTVVAILYAEPGEVPVDVNALELLAALAATSYEAIPEDEPSAGTPSSPGLIHIAGLAPAVATPAAVKPSWDDLPRPEQDRHLSAQRFARTRVAEMVLYKPGEVRLGRASGNLYDALKEEIENGREAFRKEFVETCPSMVDYFHLELQRTLAKDKAGALGPEYPGPLLVGAGAGSV